VYLEKEIMLRDYQFYYANDYINHMYVNETEKDSEDEKLELLLGVQGWRYGLFRLINIENVTEMVDAMPEEE